MLLKPSECSPEVLNFLANKTCECYVALCDWPSVQEWQASVLALKKVSSASTINLKTDFNYIRSALQKGIVWYRCLHKTHGNNIYSLLLLSFRALSSFEEGDFTECQEQLGLLPGEDFGFLNSTSRDKLGMCLCRWVIYCQG